MKRITLLIAIALMGLQICHAQYTEKMSVIALGNFTGGHANELRNAVIASASKCRVGVTILDWNDAQANPDIAATVDYILTGSTGEITTNVTHSGNYSYYLCTLPFSLTMMDASTGQVIDSRNTNRKSNYTDRQASLNDVVKLDGSVRPEYNALIYKNCPIRVPVQVIQDVKKNRVETVIIAGGSDIGVREDLTFDVQMESEIAGKKIYKTIGEAKVKEILSGEMTLCTITKGGKEVMKMFDDDVTVVLTSNEKDSFGETMNKIGGVLFH